jgi:hypothetical protein
MGWRLSVFHFWYYHTLHVELGVAIKTRQQISGWEQTRMGSDKGVTAGWALLKSGRWLGLKPHKNMASTFRPKMLHWI